MRSLRIERNAELSNGKPIAANVISERFANSIKPGVRGVMISGGGARFGDLIYGRAISENEVFDHYGTIARGYAAATTRRASTAVLIEPNWRLGDWRHPRHTHQRNFAERFVESVSVKREAAPDISDKRRAMARLLSDRRAIPTSVEPRAMISASALSTPLNPGAQ